MEAKRRKEEEARRRKEEELRNKQEEEERIQMVCMTVYLVYL